MTAAGRKNTIFGNTCSESLNQLFALVLCQQRIQPVVVKSDVEIMADMAFEEGGRIAVEVGKFVFAQPVSGIHNPFHAANLFRFENGFKFDLISATHGKVLFGSEV